MRTRRKSESLIVTTLFDCVVISVYHKNLENGIPWIKNAHAYWTAKTPKKYAFHPCGQKPTFSGHITLYI